MNHVVLLSIIISTLIMVLPFVLLLIKHRKENKQLNINKLDFRYAIVGQKVTWKDKYTYKGKIIKIDRDLKYPIICEFTIPSDKYPIKEAFTFKGEYSIGKKQTLFYDTKNYKNYFGNIKIGKKVIGYHNGTKYIGSVIDILTNQYPIICQYKELPYSIKYSINGICRSADGIGYIKHFNKIMLLTYYIDSIINLFHKNLKHYFRPFEKPKLKINKSNKKIQVKIQPEVKIIITNN